MTMTCSYCGERKYLGIHGSSWMIGFASGLISVGVYTLLGALVR